MRVAYTRGAPPGRVIQHRIRHRTQLHMELREARDRPREWADGTLRFAPR